MNLELLTADVLYSGMGLPQSPGGVVLSGQTIAATGHPDELRRLYPEAVERRAGAVISPLPVNAHSHLDMSSYPFAAMPYFRWIPEHVIANRHLRGLEGAKAGLKQVQRSGAAGLGDIVWSAEVMEYLLRESDLPGVLYWEVLGPDPRQAETIFEKARLQIEGWRALERPGGPRVGISPHATYTVSHTLHRLLSDYARREGLPLQIHVAEHPSELELFGSGRGALAESFGRNLQGFGLADVFGRKPDAQLTPVSYLADLGVLDARPTLIHMVAITEQDAKIVGQAGSPVVSCPRSNANLHCGTMPWALLAQNGVEVALGTDSVASGETLNIFDEIAAAMQLYPELEARTIIRAAVKGGRRVLGLPMPFLRRGEAWDERYLWPETASWKRADT